LVDLTILQQTLSIVFNDPSLLKQALTHSSYSHENPGLAPASNERLEFLGDAVLGMIAAEKLYNESSKLNEGEMTKLRAVLINKDALAHKARAIKLGEYLYLGVGERASGGQRKAANLARALEALIAAIYIDQGLDKTSKIISKLFERELQNLPSTGAEADYKSRIQEYLQARQSIPSYHTIEVTGPDHKKQFTVEVRVGDSILGRGTGKNKKAAEVEAARLALQQLPVDFTP